jgi:NAD(P)-dependent dehydrogenase (short-subunit alcohol dehydrogenase family)
MGRFEDRVALVTGGTQGVGEAAARLLAEEGAAGVVVAGRNVRRGERVATDLEAIGTEAAFVPVDLADVDSCRELVAAVDEQFGRVDVLVNAAGNTLRGTILDTSAELWDDIMAINARAPFLLMQDSIRIMLREDIRGSIVNVASVAATGAVPGLLPYAASKAALISSSKNVAYAMAWHRIRVNVVSPGWMDTPGEDAIQRRFHGAGEDWLEEAEARQPFGRLIKVDELARAIAYLASDDSGLMTGAVLDFDQSVPGAGQQPIPTWEETPR